MIQSRSKIICRYRSTPESCGEDFSIGKGRGSTLVGVSGKAEIVDGDDGVFVEGLDIPVDDVDGAGHGGDIQAFAGNRGRRRSNISPAVSV